MEEGRIKSTAFGCTSTARRSVPVFVKIGQLFKINWATHITDVSVSSRAYSLPLGNKGGLISKA